MALLNRDPTTTPPAGGGVSDGELVARVQAGDTSAFDELFQHHNNRLCTFLARLMHNDELGRDIAQDAFMKAFQALLSLQETVYFKSWLYRIALNLAKDHWRHSQLIQWVPWEEHDECSTIESMSIEGPEKQVEETELVRMALAQVSREVQPCLLLDIVEEMKQHEIATFLGMSERSVRRYISRGKKELSEAYSRLVNEQDPAMKRRSAQ
jgi:RNA polymerase sigma-70 factor (ECF subfamily)